MNKYVCEKLDLITRELSNLDIAKNSTFLITGSTGYIGSYLIYTLEKLNELRQADYKIYALARNKEKYFKCNFNSNIVIPIFSNMESLNIPDLKVNYIIHTASNTASKYFVEHPVELINENYIGLFNLLKIAKQQDILKSFVYISSLEYYGICLDDKSVKETESFPIDITNPRSSYSEGKRFLELLCFANFNEYQVPIKTIRLGQTFGPGIGKEDNRVFAQFAKSVITNTNISLATKGETKRSYCSIVDAVIGIMTVLVNGKNGEAYNLASDNSYISILDMAKLFIEDTNLKIIFLNTDNKQYLETIKFALDTTKIKEIGFKSLENIEIMVKDFKDYYQDLNI